MSELIHFLLEHQLVVLFVSAFLSSTLLPGNSEAVLATYTWQLSPNAAFGQLVLLWLVATLGNGLGSMSTYALARFLPNPKSDPDTSKYKNTAFQWIERYGTWAMLLSWLPIVGDVLCGVAGWLRLPLLPTTFCIFLGKALRYGLILWSIYGLSSYIA